MSVGHDVPSIQIRQMDRQTQMDYLTLVHVLLKTPPSKSVDGTTTNGTLYKMETHMGRMALWNKSRI